MQLCAAAGADGWLELGAGDGAFDGIVLVDKDGFRGHLRQLEPWAARDAIIVVADPDWIVDPAVRAMTAGDLAWNTTADVNYVARSGLRGHYLEFGTFWGSSFFPAYHRLHPWLDGQFYGFDSFKGISKPLDAETALSAGDFQEGAYFCNLRSFEAGVELCGLAPERVRLIPGFYSESLANRDPAEYGLTPKSVSLCVVDCDLFDPTVEVLEFVSPLLDDGALIYFDDWRLCRADPKLGERGAALQWLLRNPDFELINFPGDTPVDVASWQHAWFIFQRR